MQLLDEPFAGREEPKLCRDPSIEAGFFSFVLFSHVPYG